MHDNIQVWVQRLQCFKCNQTILPRLLHFVIVASPTCWCLKLFSRPAFFLRRRSSSFSNLPIKVETCMFVRFDHFADSNWITSSLDWSPWSCPANVMTRRRCQVPSFLFFNNCVHHALYFSIAYRFLRFYTASFDFILVPSINTASIIPLHSIYTASIILLPSAFLPSACQRSCGGNPGTTSSGSSLTTRGSAPKQASTTGCRPCASGCWGVSIETPTWA